MYLGALASLQSDKDKHLFHASAKVCLQIVSGVNQETQDNDVGGQSRTELDSHANMPVVGKNAFVLEDHG